MRKIKFTIRKCFIRARSSRETRSDATLAMKERCDRRWAQTHTKFRGVDGIQTFDRVNSSNNFKILILSYLQFEIWLVLCKSCAFMHV